MDHGIPEGHLRSCPTAFWWFSALLTPSLIALFPVCQRPEERPLLMI